jgi:hypothetical protein
MHAFVTLVNVLPGAADGLGYVAIALGRHLAGTWPSVRPRTLR